MIKSVLKLGVLALTAAILATPATPATREACSRFHSDCLQRSRDSSDTCYDHCNGDAMCELKCDDREEKRSDSCNTNLQSCNIAADEEFDAMQDLRNRSDSGTITQFGAPTTGGWDQWNSIINNRLGRPN